MGWVEWKLFDNFEIDIFLYLYNRGTKLSVESYYIDVGLSHSVSFKWM